MNKNEVIDLLKQKHDSINSIIESIDEIKLYESRNVKWSIAEEIGHLITSLKQSNKGILLPKFFLKYKFGTNNRIEKNYEEVVAKYLSKLESNPITNNPFVVKNVEKINKQQLLKVYKKEQVKFEKRIKQFSEKELSTLLLPHPLLGKLTIREFVYFTIYHTKHHSESCSK